MNVHQEEYERPLAKVDRHQLSIALLQMSAAVQHFATDPSSGHVHGGDPWDDQIMGKVRVLLEIIVELETLLMLAPPEQGQPVHWGNEVRSLVMRHPPFPHR
jgi:hypothetical protein